MLTYRGLPQALADAYRGGAPDAYGATPERDVSDGTGTPCRCCLRNVPKGKGMLILAHRPFETLHPYAETGPIFLCADACSSDGTDAAPVLAESPTYLLKGYGYNDRIMYGTGQITDAPDVASYAQELLDRPDIAFVDVRSAKNNCWLVRITAS